ncbi:MAG: hypothetical protein COA69_01885 [Robiginitomaculum sp.]|nr:MAG: hypothetical protein COA69_01885 [Robiginitomaculum sp.]
MLDPITYTIEVPCDQKQAFEVFVDDFGSWWPLAKRSTSMISGHQAKSVSLDPKPGGKIMEIGHDGTEHLWGTVRTYDPYTVFSMDFHMGLPATNPSSLVEVRFELIDDAHTRVTLTQSNWEAYGDMAEMMRGGYGSSWNMIFGDCYKAACGG